MKCSAWSSLVISACSACALAWSPSATAHIVATPHFAASGGKADVSFTGPNERRQPMLGFRLTIPSEFQLVSAHPSGDWRPEVRGSTVVWRGGRLGFTDEETFTLELETPTGLGPATFKATQLYGGGSAVRWRVYFTVTPADDEPSQNLGWALVTGIVGLLVLTVGGVLLWQRRGALQER